MELATVEWAKFANESSHASDINRRIPDRVRCSNKSDVHQGSMDGHGQIESYQLPGAEDCFVCSSALAITVGVTSVGQYNGCPLPIEGKEHTVQISALSSSRDSGFGQPTPDIATTKLPIGTDEHAGQCPLALEGTRRMDAGCRREASN